MRVSWRNWALAAGLTGLLLPLAGCGNGSGKPSASENVPLAANEVALDVDGMK